MRAGRAWGGGREGFDLLAIPSHHHRERHPLPFPSSLHAFSPSFLGFAVTAHARGVRIGLILLLVVAHLMPLHAKSCTTGTYWAHTSFLAKSLLITHISLPLLPKPHSKHSCQWPGLPLQASARISSASPSASRGLHGGGPLRLSTPQPTQEQVSSYLPGLPRLIPAPSPHSFPFIPTPQRTASPYAKGTPLPPAPRSLSPFLAPCSCPA